MDKEKYLSIRNELNFVPNSAMLRNQMLQDLGIVLLSTWLLCERTAWSYALSQVLLACLYFRAFGAMHEAVHGSLSKKRLLNEWLGVVYGGICLLPYTTWRTVHLDHHAWAGNIEKDPVMRIVREFPGKPEFRKKLDTCLWRSWIPYMAFLQEVVFWSASVKLILGKKTMAGMYMGLLASIAAPLLMFASLLVAGRALGGVWMLLPSIVAYLVLVEVVNFPHHLSLPRVAGDGKLSLWEQYKISRTCVYSSWFSRFVLLNFNYHAEHHMFPNLPWYELAGAHKKIKEVSPEGYQMCQGHEWIRLNRQKDLKEVLAPTRFLELDRIRKPDAA
jgi:fatty acid desaturase